MQIEDWNIVAIIWLLAAHWIADFALQTDEMALNKSKSNYWLTRHVFRYSLFMMLATFSLTFGAITFVCHWLTDWLTSRWTSRLFFFQPMYGNCRKTGTEAERMYWALKVPSTRHQFFIVIGLDQLLHQVQLLLTFWLLWA